MARFKKIITFLKYPGRWLPTFTVFVLIPFTEWMIRRFCRGGRTTFFNDRDFPWVAEVEARTQAVKGELDAVLAGEIIPFFHQVSEEQAPLAGDEKWRTFFFWIYGRPVEDNLRLCPATAAALGQIPGMKSAFFSILEAGKHIAPHRGPFNGVLRYHLGLIIPDLEKCRIRVGEQVRHWDVGKSLIFDDSFEHEAWNESEYRRVVLFVDFERPLRGPIGALNRFALRQIGKTPFAAKMFNSIVAMKNKRRVG